MKWINIRLPARTAARPGLCRQFFSWNISSKLNNCLCFLCWPGWWSSQYLSECSCRPAVLCQSPCRGCKVIKIAQAGVCLPWPGRCCVERTNITCYVVTPSKHLSLSIVCLQSKARAWMMIFDAVFRECVKCQYLVMIHCVTAAAAHWAPCLGWALMGRDQEQDTGHWPHLTWPRSVDTAWAALPPFKLCIE